MTEPFDAFDQRRAALERALRHIGEAVTEAEVAACARQESRAADTPASRVSRRRFLSGVGMAAATAGAAAVTVRPAAAKAPPGAIEYPVQADSTREQGRVMGEDGGYGSRSQFETEVRAWQPARTASFTPMQNGHGIITPSGLHYERHHGGIPNIDPRRHTLVIHGLVDRPMKFSVADLMRFPSVSRVYFLECSGTSGTELMKATMPTVQRTHGLVSTSEWTGVPVSTLLKQVGLKDNAAWVLAEGADAAVMTRSVPLDKCLSDALVVYAQNGEAIRPEQGYPIRLFLPGWEGNISIKWLRRLEVGDRPYQTREETSKYSDLITRTGKARQFTFTMEAKSVITFPSGEHKLPGPGFYEISGLAWTGRGKIARVEITTDGGKSWNLASLQDPILPIAQTRFRYPWVWDGAPAVIASRATDETGYTQPTKQQLIAERGPFEAGLFYHMNGIQHWSIDRDGQVKNWYPRAQG
ncbi:MAG TPA: sulfite dehydrogenase [Burkholderiales bacterium]|nr:sulfite dehydrogenase [Burkholderiales bacterium]